MLTTQQTDTILLVILCLCYLLRFTGKELAYYAQRCPRLNVLRCGVQNQTARNLFAGEGLHPNYLGILSSRWAMSVLTSARPGHSLPPLLCQISLSISLQLIYVSAHQKPQASKFRTNYTWFMINVLLFLYQVFILFSLSRAYLFSLINRMSRTILAVDLFVKKIVSNY